MRRAVLVAGLVLGCLATIGAQPPAPAEASVASKMVSIARGELKRGVREVPDGSNRGSRIRMYGRSTTPRFYPAPWCAYFVSWVARRAGRPLGPAGRGFGYVPYLRAWARATGRWRSTPRSGDLIVFPQHVGLVEAVYRNGTLTTIEGNSSNRVSRRHRRWREAGGYVRVAAGGTLQAPGRRSRQRPSRLRQPFVPRITLYPSSKVAVGQTVDLSAHDSSGDIVGYRWDLDGDGRFDDARGDSATRRFTRPGSVNVGLRITHRSGRRKITRKRITVSSNRAPIAELTLPRSARINTPVTARADRSRDPDGRIVRYEWDMNGDGAWEAGEKTRTARYPRPGVYAVGLRVYDEQGAMTETIRTLEVTQRGPTARVSGPRSAGLGQEVAFDGSRSSDPDGQIAAWRWDFDGDGIPDAEGPRPRWRFQAPGSRQIELVVADEWGAEARARWTVQVGNRAPTARFVTVGDAVAGEDTIFDASGSTDPDSAIARYEWDFDGDGHTDASGQRVGWRFLERGSRRVRLRVVDEWGAQHTVSSWVRLLQRPVARLSLVTASPRAGSPVTLSAVGSTDPDGSIRRLEWDFDGDEVVDRVTTRVSTAVAWTPATAGEHRVLLTVVDDHGLRDTTELVVAVAASSEVAP